MDVTVGVVMVAVLVPCALWFVRAYHHAKAMDAVRHKYVRMLKENGVRPPSDKEQP